MLKWMRLKKMVTPAARREASLAFVSRLRSASGERVQRSEPIGPRSATAASQPDDTAVLARLRELATIRRRFGYRRLHVLLRREGDGSTAWNGCR